MKTQTQQPSSTILVIAKLLGLALVPLLLIGHGTELPDKNPGVDVDPCDGFTVEPIPYCVDYANTAADIATLDGLTVLDRDLLISRTDLVNLDFLSNITEIQGQLKIIGNDSLLKIATEGTPFALTQVQSLFIGGNDVLQDLNGLNGVTAIPGEIVISSNNQLSTLDDVRFGAVVNNIEIQSNSILADVAALQNTVIAGDLIIDSNSLTDLNDLSALTSTTSFNFGDGNITTLSGISNLQSAGAVTIRGCTLLTDFSGLHPSFSFSSLSIYTNPLITSLAGLSTGNTILGKLAIRSNSMLLDITALSNVTEVTGDLDLSVNVAMSSLAGMENILAIGGEASVTFNNSLTSTAALGSLISANSLSVSRNANLTDLGLTSLNRLKSSLTITNNAALCETGVNGADSLLQQVLAGGGIGVMGNTTEGITISGNLACP